MQRALFAHERLGNTKTLRDGGQFLIEHTGEGEQVVALVLQGDAHWANALCVLGLAARQFRDEKILQIPAL